MSRGDIWISIEEIVDISENVISGFCQTTNIFDLDEVSAEFGEIIRPVNNLSWV